MTGAARDVEDELMTLRCLSGELGAWEEMVRRWGAPFLSHARALLGGEGDEAKDVAQETWVAIAKGLPRLDDPARFRGWAFRILTNKCADTIARRRQRRRIIIGASERVREAAAPTNTEDDIGTLRSAIAELDLERLAMLRMFYVEGMSMSEIADALAMPTGTIKSRLHHTRQLLHDRLEPDKQETSNEQLSR